MYILELTEDDFRTINFVGYRYSWSKTLQDNTRVGINKIPEHIAWNIKDEFEADTEGGHSFFPMLDPNCTLAEKLFKFMDEIV